MSRVFIDIDRPESQTYQELMNALDPNDLAFTQDKLEQMIEDHPDYLDPYITLYAIYQNQDDFAAAETALNRAYNRALLLIMDDKKQWPDTLEWEETTNQHIIRTIFNKSIDFWMDNNRKEAKEALDALLKMNPDDVIGARFYALAIDKNFAYEAFMNRFMKDGYLSDEIDSWYESNQ